MRNIWTIARREYRLLFASPIAYAVAFLFLLILGILFFNQIQNALFQAAYQPYVPGIQIIISPMLTLFLFTMPALTMRTLAEEQRMGTLELLLTAPVRDWEVIVGKWLGAWFFIISLLAVTIVYPIALNQMIEPGIDPGPVISGYIGLLFMSAGLIAIGVAISALFNNQVAAFFTSLAVGLLVWIVGYASPYSGGLWSEISRYLNLLEHYRSFYQGILDLSDMVYFMSLTALGLLLGTLIIESRRWR